MSDRAAVCDSKSSWQHGSPSTFEKFWERQLQERGMSVFDFVSAATVGFQPAVPGYNFGSGFQQ